MVEARIVRCRGGVGAGRALGGALGRLFGRALGRARVGSSAGNSVVRSAGNSVVRSADCEARKGRWQESRLARGVCGDAWVATSVMRGLKAPPAVQSAACGAKCRHRGRPSSRWRRISPLATEISVAIGANCRHQRSGCSRWRHVSPLAAVLTTIRRRERPRRSRPNGPSLWAPLRRTERARVWRRVGSPGPGWSGEGWGLWAPVRPTDSRAAA